MKLLTLVLIACQFVIAAPQAICQETRLHLTRFFPESSPGRVELTASSAKRDVSGSGATILHLSGDVEMRMITCRPGQDRAIVCDQGSMVLHADTVDYNEKTGEIQASGNVHVAPYPNGPSKSPK
jgi:lipopolysaccharide assembly outer membrane protein LptD (OstA)